MDEVASLYAKWSYGLTASFSSTDIDLLLFRVEAHIGDTLVLRDTKVEKVPSRID